MGEAAPMELQTMLQLATVEDQADSNKHSQDSPLTAQDSPNPVPPSQGWRLVLLLICLFMGNFLVGYDSSCIGTLVPVITDEFHALHDLGWYQTAYLLTLCAPMLVYGRLYSLYSMKTLYMSSVGIFLAGSVLTAAGPTSSAFIFVRALAGLGGAGINSGINIIISYTIPLKRRPIYLAICGAVECAALAFGPLIGGSIARFTTWRVAFYITIPLGVIIIVTAFFCMSHFRQPEHLQDSHWKRLKQIDWGGLACELPMTACLILALQWAGTQYAWKSWRVVLLLAVAAALLLAFLFIEYRAGERSMVPFPMLRQRSVAFASLVTFCNFAALWAVAYYLPLYFQAVRGATTLASGIMYLPLAVTMSAFALIGGPMTTFVGYYSPVLVFGTVLTAIGAGIMTTLRPDSSATTWVTCQILYGIGIGLGFQPPFIAVQTVVESKDIPTSLVLLSFIQIFGGIVVLSVAQNVFFNRLSHNLVTAVPQVDPGVILQHGALSILNTISPEYRDAALSAFNMALVSIFYIALGLTCLATLGALGIEWKSVKQKETQKFGQKTKVVNENKK